MPLTSFHPAIAHWFATTLGEPSPAQVRGWERIRQGHHTLIAAPTGSGKTLAAFLVALDGLFRQGSGLQDVTQVLYVSPLRALSHDVQKNLEAPLVQMRERDPALPEVRVLVRTGDTKASARTAMGKRPPHVLVTTPESLYILLTSAAGRRMLAGVRTVVIDEIHALVRDKRGSHLALSLERLVLLAGEVQRIGLSATQRPIEDVARFLAGVGRSCEIVDAGHRRALDVALAVPRSPLSAVCSTELWDEIYTQVVELIAAHKTTLVFTNTRKLCERVAARLSDRIGKEHVTSHHGSLSRAHRLLAEQRLKRGELKALVTTASLELGIDIGDVDLVVQIGVPGTIAVFLQRVGRAGHGPHRLPKGRIFPLTIDELIASTALLECVQRGELDRLQMPVAPLDILAQQLVAACVAGTCVEAEVRRALQRAWPYRQLSDDDWEQTLALHTGERLSLLHRDQVAGTLRATKRARLPALTAGGAIPDVASYEVVLEPSGERIGTVEEDFAVEASIGDVFQLGNHSWRIVRMERGTLRVADAGSTPPSLPFWFGEALARSGEFAAAVAELRVRAAAAGWVPPAGLPTEAVAQIAAHCQQGLLALGCVPSQQTLVAERFLDEGGGSQLVVHAPFGSRINRALGLALRKRFCRGFGFELQAAANEEAILLSLGPMHEFALAELFTWLHPNTARDVLVQAVLGAPLFATRWRWNAQRALCVPRFAHGKRTPTQIARMRAQDFLSAAFPQVNACAETLPGGDLPVPWEHPLVRQTLHDCLDEAMDCRGFVALLEAIHGGLVRTVAVETAQPSTFAQGILHALPYMFLDDAPLEERRTQAVPDRVAGRDRTPDEVEGLAPELVAAVAAEVQIAPRSREELHEALLWCGWLEAREAVPFSGWIDELVAAGRAVVGDGRVRAAGLDQDLRSQWKGRLDSHAVLHADAPELSSLVAEGFAQRVRVSGQPGIASRRLVLRMLARAREAARSRFTPVSTAQYERSVRSWQHAEPGTELSGPAGVLQVVRQLAGCEVPAAAWEKSVLPARVAGYRREWLDQLAFAGEVVWLRLTGGSRMAVRRAPLALLPRDELPFWLELTPRLAAPELGAAASQLATILTRRGPSFLRELRALSELLPSWLEDGLRELVTQGCMTCDSFAALRQLLVPDARRRVPLEPPGRFAWIERAGAQERTPLREDELALQLARKWLLRYGVIVRRALEPERVTLPWRAVVRALRLLELRGEAVGGRFVAGWDGEQFGLREAVRMLQQMPSASPPSAALAPVDPARVGRALTSSLAPG